MYKSALMPLRISFRTTEGLEFAVSYPTSDVSEVD